MSSLPDDTGLVHVASTGPMGDLASVDEFVDATATRGLPVVLTIVDLHDRDLVDPRAPNRRLDLLVDAASEVITLTSSAAARAADRWGRRPTVIGPAHVAPIRTVARAARRWRAAARRSSWDGALVGVPLSTTARAAPWEAATALSAVLDLRPRVRVDLLVTDEQVVRDLVDHPLLAHERVRVVRQPRLDDARLFAWLETVDVLLLPLRHATHSAWSSLCDDLAVALVTVDDPSMVELGVTAAYPADPVGMVDVDLLVGALLGALSAPLRRPDVGARLAMLDGIRASHRAVYRRAVAPAWV